MPSRPCLPITCEGSVNSSCAATLLGAQLPIPQLAQCPFHSELMLPMVAAGWPFKKQLNVCSGNWGALLGSKCQSNSSGSLLAPLSTPSHQ